MKIGDKNNTQKEKKEPQKHGFAAHNYHDQDKFEHSVLDKCNSSCTD